MRTKASRASGSSIATSRPMALRQSVAGLPWLPAPGCRHTARRDSARADRPERTRHRACGTQALDECRDQTHVPAYDNPQHRLAEDRDARRDCVLTFAEHPRVGVSKVLLYRRRLMAEDRRVDQSEVSAAGHDRDRARESVPENQQAGDKQRGAGTRGVTGAERTTDRDSGGNPDSKEPLCAASDIVQIT